MQPYQVEHLGLVKDAARIQSTLAPSSSCSHRALRPKDCGCYPFSSSLAVRQGTETGLTNTASQAQGRDDLSDLLLPLEALLKLCDLCLAKAPPLPPAHVHDILAQQATAVGGATCVSAKAPPPSNPGPLPDPKPKKQRRSVGGHSCFKNSQTSMAAPSRAPRSLRSGVYAPAAPVWRRDGS